MNEPTQKRSKLKPKVWSDVWPEEGLTATFLLETLAKLPEPPAPDSAKTGNYTLHYRALKNWFAGQSEWTVDAVILGSLAVYGWMPSILEGRTPKDRVITEERAERIAKALNDKAGEIELDFVNSSPVGTSKFLHFWCPQRYAIWDSRVRMAVVGDCKKLISATGEFEQYLMAMREIVEDLPVEERGEKMRRNEQRLFWAGRN